MLHFASLEEAQRYTDFDLLNSPYKDAFMCLVEDGDGLWTVHPWGDGVMIHADMRKHFKAKDVLESGKEAFQMLFNSGIEAIYSRIPKELRGACHMAVLSGMEFTHEEDGIRFYRIQSDESGAETCH